MWSEVTPRVMSDPNISDAANEHANFDKNAQFTVLESDTSSTSVTRERRKRRYKKSGSVNNSPKNKLIKGTRNTTSPIQPPVIPSTSTSTTQMNEKIDKSLPKPPPIMIKNIVNFTRFCQQLKVLLGNDKFYCRSRVNDLLLHTNDSESYRKAVKFLCTNSYDYHCYQLKEDKCYRVVIRGLHQTTSNEEIKEELIKNTFPVIRVHQVLHPISKTPLPLFFVDLAKNKNSEDIFKLQYLLYTKINVEEPRMRTSIAQCTRCQDYGHTRTYCNHPHRCVRCGGPHQSTQCTRPLNIPATCALCGGAHPANYKGCTTHRELQTQRKLRQETLKPKATTAPEPSTMTSTLFPVLPPKRKTHPTVPDPTIKNAANPPRETFIYTPAPKASPPVWANTKTRTSSYAHVASTAPTSIPTTTPAPNTEIIPHLTSFLNDFKSLITPLISLLTTLVSELLPKLSR